MGPMYRATVSVTQFMIPDEILWRIAVYWPDLGNHWHEASWRLHPVDDSRSASCLPDLIHSTYVLVMPGLLNEMAHRPHGLLEVTGFFCCIAELAIKPCRSSRSELRGEFGIPNTCKTGNKDTTKQQTPPNPKHNTTQKTGKCLECETRGEKRVKRPKRPNALICRTPGGSMRYPLSSSLGMMLISHSIVSIPASPSRFAI